MADLTTTFIGIKSPNPFWLASAPPTDKEYNVRRAFEAGWGGVVWKTLGEDPPIVNVNAVICEMSGAETYKHPEFTVGSLGPYPPITMSNTN